MNVKTSFLSLINYIWCNNKILDRKTIISYAQKHLVNNANILRWQNRKKQKHKNCKMLNLHFMELTWQVNMLFHDACVRDLRKNKERIKTMIYAPWQQQIRLYTLLPNKKHQILEWNRNVKTINKDCSKWKNQGDMYDFNLDIICLPDIFSFL